MLRLTSCLAALAAAALLCLAPEGGRQSAGAEALYQLLVEGPDQAAELEARLEVLRRRVAAQEAVLCELEANRLTLDEAAGRFERLGAARRADRARTRRRLAEALRWRREEGLPGAAGTTATQVPAAAGGSDR
jgi:hypothetical protein